MNASLDQWVVRLAGTFILLSVLLAYQYSMNWLWVTAFVGANLLQSSFTGFCPLAKFLAAIGIRPGAAFGTTAERD